MKKTILTLLVLAPFTAIVAQDLDWNSYPDGSLAHVFTNIGNKPVSATVTVTGATSGFAASGDPSGMSNPSRLRLEVDFKPNECVTLNITFSQPVGNLNFIVADIDKETSSPGSDSNYQDQVTITGKNGAASTNPTIGASSMPTANTVSGNVITGANPSTNNTNTVKFNGNLTQVSIQYCSGSQVVGDPGTQRIFISGLNWDDTAMPVGLVLFTAKAQDNRTVDLAWTTSWETNNKGFLIERSKDLRLFEKVAEVTELGAESKALKHYRLTDLTPYSGTSYYRLTQTDLDGKTTVFPAVSVALRDATYGVSPNPVMSNERFALRLDEPETATVNFYSAGGSTLPLQKAGVESGNLLLKAQGNISAGVYILTVEERGQTRRHRIVVK